MTQAMAEYLAQAYGYRARKLRGRWIVWCDVSDHEVEFDNITTDETLGGLIPV